MNNSAYLLSGVAAGVAGENVSIDVSHATSPSVGDGSGTVGISVTTGAVHAHHREGVTIALQAAEAAGGSQLGHIHTVGSEGGAEQSKAHD